MTRIGSLCTGYGGLDMAVESVIGGEFAWVADNDPRAAAVLAHRFPSVPNLGDLTETDWPAVPWVDIMLGGFPCQDLSYAGRGEGIQEGNRSGLWYTIANAIGVLRPRLVVLENVAAIVGRRPGLDVVLADLARLGFDAQWTCLRASDVGAPHGRKRWFAICWPAADADGPARGEWRLAAPGEAEGRWPWADACRPGRARAASDAPGDGRHARRAESARLVGRPDAALGSDGTAPDADGDGRAWGQERDSEPQGGRPGHEQRRVDPLRCVLDWGIYEPAIRRWEAILGRPAPRPTELRRSGERLSPCLPEWMMGLPEGWVTDVPGLTVNDQLHVIGNGVVPQQAAAALRLLLPAVTEAAA